MEVSGKIQVEGRSEVCEPCCIDGTSKQADGYCEECGEYMCNSCFRNHLKSRLSRDHILSSLGQGRIQDKQKEQGTQPCQKHTNQKLRYYCRHHDNAVCGDCVVVEHKGCDIEFIKDVARKFETSSEFKNMLENISRLQEEWTKNCTAQNRNRTDNSVLKEAALKEIHKFRKALNDYLDHAETEVINEAIRMSTENDDLIAEGEAKLNKVQLDFDDLRSRLDTHLYKQDRLFIHYVDCKARVSDIEFSVAEVAKKRNIKQFFFQPNQQLSDLLMSTVKLGTLKAEKRPIHDDCQKEKDSKRQKLGLATGARQVVQQTKKTRGHAGGATQVVNRKNETREEDRGATVGVQQTTTPDTNPPSQQYSDPDPRSRGFDVGKRVKDRASGKEDHPNWDDNYRFYMNQIPSKPDGDYIDDIHVNWWGDYKLLEVHHGYIQWLFPIRESGLNWRAQELQLHEIEKLQKSRTAMKRILTSYRMMLDFYGMKLADEKDGTIERADNWPERSSHLNRSFHNYLRITRILKCLGEFGYEHLKKSFIKFVLYEGLVEGSLPNVIDSCFKDWIGVLKDEEERREMYEYYYEFYEDENCALKN